MQLLFLLLASLAAASSLGSVVPTKEHYLTKIKSLWGLPAPQCYEFSPYTRGEWLEAKSYEAILKIYPGERHSELDESAFKTDCATKLQHKAAEIYKDITDHRNKWLQSIKSSTNNAKNEYRRKIVAFTQDYTRDASEVAKAEFEMLMKKQLASFNDSVNAMISQAAQKWTSAHDKIYSRVLAFQAKIVSEAVAAFKARTKKIIEFATALDKRIKSFVSKYQRTLVERAKKNISTYGQQQFKTFGLNSTVDSYSLIGKSILTAQRNYGVGCWNDVKNLIINYRKRLNRYKNDLIKSYSSSYQIDTCAGKLTFHKKKFANFCKELGEWWKMDRKKDISAYNYIDYEMSWKRPAYKNLANGDAAAVNEPVEEYEKRVSLDGQQAIQNARQVFNEWKKKWINIHSNMCKEFFKIVRQRHQFLLDAMKARLYCRYGFWCARFQARYEAATRELSRRRVTVMSKYRNSLQARFESECVRFKESLHKYESTVKSLVKSATNSYADCMDNRGDEIVEYQNYMGAKRDSDKKDLQDKLIEIGLKKCDHYKAFLSFHHGTTKSWDKPITSIWSLYKQHVGKKMRTICNQFDDYWISMLPKLVHHFECTYKCSEKTKFQCPEYSYDINWKTVNPTVEMYPFRLNYYKKYKDFTLKKIKGRYYWIN